MPSSNVSRVSFVMLVVFLLCLASFSFGRPQSNSEDTAGIPKIQFEKYSLPNGLQVILHVDRKLPMVHVNCWYHVGSKNERQGRTGFAHLFEHMMFEGSKDANEKYFGFIEKAGANLFEGGVNGTTSEDRTNYFETVPSGSLEYVLWLESDRLATLPDVLTKAKLDNEREIVKNERRQSDENQPYGRAFLLLNENAFPSGHPYAHPVIGSHEDLTAASVDDVKEFFQRYYTPNNLSLAVTGDFDPSTAKKLIEKYFGSIPPGPPLERPKHWIARLESEKLIEINDHVPQERTYFAWPTPAFFDPGDAELDLTSLILSDGLSSRLTKSLVYEKQLCSDVVSFQNAQEIGSLFVLWATARPEASLGTVEHTVSDEIARLARDGPTAEELQRAKTKWEFQYVTGLERIGGFGGKADVLNQYNTFLGDPDKIAADVQRHRNVTADSLKQVVGSWLNTDKRLLLRFHPENPSTSQVAALDRTQAPRLGTDLPFRVPEVKTGTLDNGMKIFVVERTDLPKVAVTLATRAGSVNDPGGMEGLASLDLEAAKRGTKNKTALEIDNALGDLGTALNGHVDREFSALTLDVLTRNLSPALNVLADVARNPSFPTDEVDREKKKRLDALAQAESDPESIARRVGPMLAFGRDHAYGHPVQGFKSTVAKITPQDLTRFHQSTWKPGSSALIFVGDISFDRAIAIAKESLGAWTGGAAPVVSIAPPHPLGPGKIFLINRPDAAQTFISEILPGPTREASDYYPFTVADAVWGGAAGARLGTNLREQKGYSYGVFSFPRVYSKYGLWLAGGGVQTNKTKESAIEFQKELRFIAGQKPISEAELANAKNSRVRGYAQQFESMNRVAQQIVQLWSLGVPVSELQREPDEISKASLAAVNATAEKYATPSRATLLLVGDASKIEAGLREANLGELIMLDDEGKPATLKGAGNRETSR